MPYGWAKLNESTMRYEPASAETPGAVRGYWLTEAEVQAWKAKLLAAEDQGPPPSESASEPDPPGKITRS